MQKILDSRKRNQILAVLAVGGSRTLAAKVVGCHPRSIYNATKDDPTFAEELNRAESSAEYNNLESLYKSRAIPHVNKWILERVHPDRFRPRPPGMFSVDAVRQLLGLLAARLAEQATDDDQRRKILQTMAETAKEVMVSTQPFVEQAIAMRTEFGDLAEKAHDPSHSEPAAPPVLQDSELPSPTEETPDVP